MSHATGLRSRGWTFAAALTAVGLLPLAAAAATVSLAGQPGSNQMSYSFEYLNPNATTAASVGSDYSLAVPGLYQYLNSFGQQSGTPLATSSVGAYDFMDSYRFVIGANASGDNLVASLGLGNIVAMSNLQFRLYKVSDSTTIDGTTPTPVIPGVPAGAQVITSWTGATGTDSAATTITKSFTGIQSGTYILDVAGQATGSSGGSYLGSLNLTPVPLPAALWLLASGLGGLGVLVRRRQAAA